MYCTKDDVYAAVGESHAMRMATDSAADQTATIEGRITDAIVRASDRIDIYLRSRYSLPLSNIPDVLKDYCVQMTIYYLASRKGIDLSGTESTIRTNFEDCIKELSKVADGKLDIGIINDSGESSPQASPIVISPDSVFDVEDY